MTFYISNSKLEMARCRNILNKMTFWMAHLMAQQKLMRTFQFPRGHKKFLLLISDFLKQYFKETGLNYLTFKMPLSGKKALLSKSQENEGIQNTARNTGFTGDVNIQHGILMCKIVMSLINITPEMYAMVNPISIRMGP